MIGFSQLNKKLINPIKFYKISGNFTYLIKESCLRIYCLKTRFSGFRPWSKRVARKTLIFKTMALKIRVYGLNKNVHSQSTQICMNFLLHLYECKLSYKKHEKFTKTILNGQ